MLRGDKAFRFPCRLLNIAGCYEVTFISNGFKNWKKAIERFKARERTASRLNASQRWQERIKSLEAAASNKDI